MQNIATNKQKKTVSPTTAIYLIRILNCNDHLQLKLCSNARTFIMIVLDDNDDDDDELLFFLVLIYERESTLLLLHLLLNSIYWEREDGKKIENTNEIYKELLKWNKKKCSNFFTNKNNRKSDDKVKFLVFHFNAFRFLAKLFRYSCTVCCAIMHRTSHFQVTCYLFRLSNNNDTTNYDGNHMQLVSSTLNHWITNWCTFHSLNWRIHRTHISRPI